MSGLSKNIQTYLDVKAVADAALANGGARLTLPSRGQATKWRQRFHMFRQLMLKRQEELVPANEFPTTPYDPIKVDKECGCVNVCKYAPECGGNVLLLRIGAVAGKLETLDGQTLSVGPAKVDVFEVDTVLEAAKAAKRELGFGGFEE